LCLTVVNINRRVHVSLCEQVLCQHEDLHGDDLLDYGGLEFPQINYGQNNTRPYRYFYGCGFRHLVGDSLLKMDLKDKSLKVGWEEPTRGLS
jgi:beta,beta-carotene 9',10'-dioxygenase